MVKYDYTQTKVFAIALAKYISKYANDGWELVTTVRHRKNPWEKHQGNVGFGRVQKRQVWRTN